MKPSAIITILALASVSAFSATITLDEATRYQTIEGFGAFGGLYPTWQSSPLFTAPFVTQVATDLGLSMNREDYSTGSETMQYLAALKAAGVERIIASTWSPPANWKSNNSDINGGSLLPEHYVDFGNLCVSFIQTVKQQAGVDLYGISLQNEPAFSEPYTSCVYTPAQYRDMVKVVGPMIHAQYPSVRIFGAEHMLANWGTFEGTLIADTASRRQMGALAVHGYSDGVHPTAASASAALWRRAAGNCASAGKPLWMTETSGYLNTNWADCFQLGEMIYCGLKYGKIAVWTWWQLSEVHHSNLDDDRYSLMYDGNPSKLYYVAKQYYRYIRPGAVQVRAGSSDTLVMATAFAHATDRTMTLVILNATASQQSVSIVGGGPGNYAAYRTSASDNCVSAGSMARNAVVLAPSSVTTLFATNYATAVDVGRARSARAAGVVGQRAGYMHLFDLDGRMVVGEVRRLPAGAYVSRSTVGAGDASLSVKQ
jgi:glucuronoarabinoxylan endo-1,4-beta-xylanase